MSDQDSIVEQLITDKGLTAPRITKDDVDSMMSRMTYVTEHRPNNSTVTFVHAFLDGKFYMATGHSACVDPANYDVEIGVKIATSKASNAARERIWEHMGFMLYLQQNRQN